MTFQPLRWSFEQGGLARANLGSGMSTFKGPTRKLCLVTCKAHSWCHPCAADQPPGSAVAMLVRFLWPVARKGPRVGRNSGVEFDCKSVTGM